MGKKTHHLNVAETVKVFMTDPVKGRIQRIREDKTHDTLAEVHQPVQEFHDHRADIRCHHIRRHGLYEW